MSKFMSQTATALSEGAVTRLVNRRANALADRLEQGARMLMEFASGLTEEQWQTRVPHDGRKVGVMVHHVGNMYPLEIQIAQLAAKGEPVKVTPAMVDEVNAAHAREFEAVTKEQAIEFVARNSAVAAAAIRAFSDQELDRAVAVALNSDAPLTCQFVLEDHAVRHSYHHLARIKKALG